MGWRGLDRARGVIESGLALPLVCAGAARGRPPGRRRRPPRYAHRRGLDRRLGRMVRGPGPRLQPRPRPRHHPCRRADADRAMRPRQPDLADRPPRRGMGGPGPRGDGADHARQHRRRHLRGRVCRRPDGRRDRRALYRARARLAVQHAPPANLAIRAPLANLAIRAPLAHLAIRAPLARPSPRRSRSRASPMPRRRRSSATSRPRARSTTAAASDGRWRPRGCRSRAATWSISRTR